MTSSCMHIQKTTAFESNIFLIIDIKIKMTTLHQKTINKIKKINKKFKKVKNV